MYTKGEWKVVANMDGEKTIVRTESGFVAVTKVVRPIEEIEANAQLIAAAPDTAEALRDLISFLIHDGLTTNNRLVPIINKGTKALKKAGLDI